MEGEIPTSGDERLKDRASRFDGRGGRPEVRQESFRPDSETDWDYVRQTMSLLVAKEGFPTTLDDLSVDSFTASRLRRTDYASVLTIWQKPDGARFHPGVVGLIEESLAGRDPSVSIDEGVIRIVLNVADDSFHSQLEVELYALRLSLMIDGLPRVVVGRYRNFPTEGDRTRTT